MKTKILNTAILICVNLILTAQIIHVPGDQSSIQAGINAANNGDTVLVDTGVYNENIDFMGKAITVASHYLFQKDSLFIYNTIIDGSQPSNPDKGSVVSFVNGEDTLSCIYGFTITGGSGSVVSWTWPVKAGGGINMYNSTCKIESNIIKENEVIQTETDGWAMGGGISSGPPDSDRFAVIRNNHINNNFARAQGIATAWNLGWAHGGGIVMANKGIIEGNRIIANICKSDHGYTVGGGIRMQGENIVVEVINNTITYNESIAINSNAFGGGISCSSANTTIEKNNIRNNITSGVASRGGGIYFDLDDTYFANVLNNVFIGNECITNSSYCYGGAVGMVNSYNLQIINNLFDGNIALNGGGIYIKESHPVLINNTLSENIAEETGGGIYIDDTGSGAIVMNTILWGDSANGQPNEIYISDPDLLEISYSDIENGWEGNGNINDDPLFYGEGDYPYSLQDESPCVNTGTPDTNGLNLPEFDLAGNSRLYGGRIEMGAYENQNVIVGMNRLVSHNKSELNVFPNPFKNSTTIKITLIESDYTTLALYDMRGRILQTIFSEKLQKGDYKIKWDAVGLNEGVFCIQLEANGITEICKAVLVK